jgi:hypothetical protein
MFRGLLALALPLFAQSPDPDCNKAGRPPVNDKLCKHSNFCDPAQIWDFRRDLRLVKYKPAVEVRRLFAGRE